MSRFPPTTLALGGGGARGVAHLGAIEVLLNYHVPIQRIVGVSIGSLAGAMYAFNPDITAVQKQALDYLLSPAFQRHQQTLFGARPSAEDESTEGIFTWYQRVKQYLRANRLFHRVVRSPALLPGRILQDVVDYLLPDADIADARVPLVVVAVDLHSGRKVCLERGPVRDAVCASSALPGIFPPVSFGGMLLCDVGVFYSLPTSEARAFGRTHVVAVDVGSDLKPLTRCETALDVLMRMDEIGESLFRSHVVAEADLLVRPNVAGIEWFDFSSSAEMIEAGRLAATLALERTCAAAPGFLGRLGRWLRLRQQLAARPHANPPRLD